MIRRMEKKIFVRYLLPPSTEQISIFNRLFQEHYQNVKIFHFYLYAEKRKKREETVEIKIVRFLGKATPDDGQTLKFPSICNSICTFLSAMVNFHVKT